VVSENAKKEFRQGSLSSKSDAIDGERVCIQHLHPVTEAIEKKLIGDLKNVVSLTIADKTRKDPKTMKRRQDALEALQQKGYCPVLRREPPPVRRRHLRKENNAPSSLIRGGGRILKFQIISNDPIPNLNFLNLLFWVLGHC